MSFETVIGLEVHAQLKTETKLFCRCSNRFGDAGNSHTCPVCLGLPGALPVLNGQAVRYALRAGLAVGAKIQPHSVFARKNYFYPDLPKGYQISQFSQPLCLEGKLEIETAAGNKTAEIVRIHMEEDAGKLLHEDSQVTAEGSLIDLNRAGVPLIEIVGAPDLRTPEEASAYLKKLRSILRYLDVCDGNMEEGSFRCDANVSIRPSGMTKLGVKVELKNLNSFKHVENALAFEIVRQTSVLAAGGTIAQETRLWDPDQGETQAMRSKEEAHDYRYFPDPDLLPLKIPQKWLADLRRELPELPDTRKKRFMDKLKLPPYDAELLTAEKETADYFEATLKAMGQKDNQAAKLVSNFVMSEILGLMHERNETIEVLKVTPAALGKLLLMIETGKISGKIAKTLLTGMADTGADPEEMVKKQGLSQISDPDTLRRQVTELVAKNPKQVEQYRAGKTKVLGFFVGQIMKATQGRANPEMVNQILKEELKRGI